MDDDGTVIIDLDATVIPNGRIETRPIPFGLYPAILITVGERQTEGVMSVDILAAGGPESFDDIAGVLELIARTIRNGRTK